MNPRNQRNAENTPAGRTLAVRPATKADVHPRPSIRVGVALLLAVTAGALLAVLWPKMVAHTRSGSNSTPQQDNASLDGVGEQSSGRQVNRSSTRLSGTALTTEAVAQPEPTPEMRQLVDSLVRLQPPNGILTDQFATGWKENLQRLVQLGPVAIPAIQEFLAKDLDYIFGDTGRQLLGYTSARAAMFDALAQIGGPGAVGAMTTTLQTTADPREIALLAQDLDSLEPQQHHDEVLNAARQALELASSHKHDTADPAPLFEVFEKYGGATMASELVKSAGQWNYYATMALAQLPEGAGIPGLVQIAEDPKATGATREAALQMLAQASDNSPEARAALVAQARQNVISEFAWRILAPMLGGNQIGFVNSAFEHPEGLPQLGGLRTTSTSDNQNFFTVPGNLNTKQVGQRMALMNELLAATSNPEAKELLQQWKDSLSARFPASVAGL